MRARLRARRASVEAESGAQSNALEECGRRLYCLGCRSRGRERQSRAPPPRRVRGSLFCGASVTRPRALPFDRESTRLLPVRRMRFGVRQA
jgi:hypothetical protein